MPELSLKDSVENFLFLEADLLDGWKLTEWEALLTDDAQYLIPPIGVQDGATLSAAETMFVIMDDRAQLAARLERLKSSKGFCEVPRSNLRRLVSNVRVLGKEGEELRVAANFCVFRIRRAEIVQYIGQYRYQLVAHGAAYKIRSKRVILDIDVLRGQGSISIIL